MTTIAVPITNTGARAGAEVVQVYAHRAESTVMRPEQVLAGFTKVHLEAGQTTTATVEVEHADLRHWDPDQHAWVLEPGDVALRLARSSRDVVATVPLSL